MIKSLGTFWNRVVTRESTRIVHSLQKGLNTAATQLHSDAASVVRNASINNSYGYLRRMRWLPLNIYYDKRNMTNAAALKLSSAELLELDENTDMRLGEYQPEPGYVYYPLEGVPENFDPSCICSGVVHGKTIMVKNSDFVVRENSIIFRESDDPFNNDDFLVNSDAGTARRYCTLWAFGTELEDGGLYRGVGHLTGVRSKSDKDSAGVVKAVHRLRTGEACLGNITYLIGKLYGIPVSSEEYETVESVESGMVVTDAGVYVTSPGLESVNPGDILPAGTPLDGRITVLDRDADAMTLPPGLFAEGIDGPVTIYAEPVTIPNVVPQPSTLPSGAFTFDMFGDVKINDIFWNAFWSDIPGIDAESRRKNGLACFGDHIVYTGHGSLGEISPLKWWMDYVAGPQTTIIMVEGIIAKHLPPIDIEDILPADVLIIVVERKSLDDSFGFSTDDDTNVADAILNTENGGVKLTDQVSFMWR